MQLKMVVSVRSPLFPALGRQGRRISGFVSLLYTVSSRTTQRNLVWRKKQKNKKRKGKQGEKGEGKE